MLFANGVLTETSTRLNETSVCTQRWSCKMNCAYLSFSWLLWRMQIECCYLSKCWISFRFISISGFSCHRGGTKMAVSSASLMTSHSFVIEWIVFCPFPAHSLRAGGNRHLWQSHFRWLCTWNMLIGLRMHWKWNHPNEMCRKMLCIDLFPYDNNHR